MPPRARRSGLAIGPDSIGILVKDRVPYSQCSAQACQTPPFFSAAGRQLPERLDNLSDSALQRADGAGRVVLRGSEQGTQIVDVFQRSPVRVMFPRVTGGAVEEAVLINTGGGVAGGDRLRRLITALDKNILYITPPA